MTVARSLRRMGVLLTGMTLAQLIALAFMPLLGRFFSPADFGVVGLVNGFAIPLMGVAALRYDLALFLPEEEQPAVELLALSLLTTLAFVCVLFGVVAVAREPLAALVESPGLADWLWVCPALVLFGGLSNTLGYWLTRRERFAAQSAVATLTSVSTLAAQLGAGLAALGALGLVAGQLFGKALGAIALGAQVLRDDGARIAAVTRVGMLRRAREYSDFPRLQAPSTALNHVLQHLPVYVLGASFGGAVVGQWALAFMALSVPAALVMGSVRQVLLQDAGERSRRRRPLVGLLVRWTLGLYAAGLPAGLALALFGPEIFVWVFGDGWALAGHMARPMGLWLLTVVANAPASAFIPILRLNRLMLGWQLLSFALAAGAAGWASAQDDAWTVVAAFCAVMGALNVIIGVVVGWFAHVSAPRTIGPPSPD